jgi:Predicted Zn-dependent hydrolases of the beta-lactamase fold
MSLAEEIRSVGVKTGELAVCWLGQAGFLLKDSRDSILVLDPYLTNCGERIRGFKRLSPMLLRPEELRPRYHVTTHLHFDHFDYDAIPVIARNTPDALFLGPSSCVNEFVKMGIAPGQCRRLDRGEDYQDENISIRAVLADHGTMAPDAVGILLKMGGHRLYFTGDTAFHEELFREVALFHPQFAAISVNGKFGNMNATEGAEAALLTQCLWATPCHCWTFAEHGGNPGQFCETLKKTKACLSVCFRQGEIQILDQNSTLLRKEESAS